ncbi:MAG: hypothetical protein SCK70_06580, partial [bacterium]|nr:hypothetical protein [bacterium]
MYTIPIIIIYHLIIFWIFFQLRYIRKFKKQKAFNAGASKTLSQIGVKDSWIFKQLVNKGVIIPVKESRYYMDEAKAVEYSKKRRGFFYSITLLFLVLFFFFLNNFNNG